MLSTRYAHIWTEIQLPSGAVAPEVELAYLIEELVLGPLVASEHQPALRRPPSRAVLDVYQVHESTCSEFLGHPHRP
jgi:hypothetical protein